MIHESIEGFLRKLPSRAKIVCFDYGTKRIGFAVSDLSQTMAFPSGTITYIKSSDAVDKIISVLKDYNSNMVVFGLPLHMNGVEGEACVQVRSFVSELMDKTNIHVLLYDERMSSSAAYMMLSETGLKRKQKEELNDKIAASVILQGVLDSIVNVRRGMLEDVV